MALIKCSECGKEVSDKASACTNCGVNIAGRVKEDANTLMILDFVRIFIPDARKRRVLVKLSFLLGAIFSLLIALKDSILFFVFVFFAIIFGGVLFAYTETIRKRILTATFLVALIILGFYLGYTIFCDHYKCHTMLSKATDLYKEGKKAESFRTLKELVTIPEFEKHDEVAATTYCYLAEMSCGFGKCQDSVKYLEKCKLKANELSDPTAIATSNLAEGRISLQQGNFLHSRECINSANQLSVKTEDVFIFLETIIMLSNIELFSTNISAADNLSLLIINMLFFVPNNNYTGRAFLVQSDVAKLRGNLELAKEYANKAYVIFKTRENRIYKIYANELIGDIQCLMGNIDEGSARFKECMSYYLRTGNVSGQAGANMSLGQIEFQKGRYFQSEKRFRKAEFLYKEIGDIIGRSRTKIGIGKIKLKLGKVDDAIKLGKEAHFLIHDTEDVNGIATCYDFIAQAMMRKGYPKKAEHNYKKAIEIYREYGVKINEGSARRKLGYLYESTGEIRKAHEQYVKAVSLIKGTGCKDNLANLYMNIIKTKRMMNDRSARRLAEEVVRIRKNIGDKIGMAKAMLEIAAIDLEDGKKEEAAKYIETAERILVITDDDEGKASLLLMKAQMSAEYGKVEDAIDNLEKAIGIYIRLENKTKEIIARIIKSRIYIGNEQYKKSEEELEKALSIARRAKNKSDEAAILVGLSWLKEKRGSSGKKERQRAYEIMNDLGLCCGDEGIEECLREERFTGILGERYKE